MEIQYRRAFSVCWTPPSAEWAADMRQCDEGESRFDSFMLLLLLLLLECFCQAGGTVQAAGSGESVRTGFEWGVLRLKYQLFSEKSVGQIAGKTV